MNVLFRSLVCCLAGLLTWVPVAYPQADESDRIDSLILKSVEDDIAKKNRDLQIRKMNSRLQRVLGAALENEGLFASLVLLDYQRAKLQTIQSEYAKQKRQIEEVFGGDSRKEKVTLSRKLREIKQDFITEASKVLVDHQIETLTTMSLEVHGLPKSLTESKLRSAFSLSEQELSNIRDRANDLSSEVEKFVREIRKKAYDELLSGISAEKRKKIRDFYGDDFDGYFSTLKMERMALDFNYKHEQHSALERSIRKTPMTSKQEGQ